MTSWASLERNLLEVLFISVPSGRSGFELGLLCPGASNRGCCCSSHDSWAIQHQPCRMSTSETVAQPATKQPTLSGSGLTSCAKTENTSEKMVPRVLSVRWFEVWCKLVTGWYVKNYNNFQSLVAGQWQEAMGRISYWKKPQANTWTWHSQVLVSGAITRN